MLGRPALHRPTFATLQFTRSVLQATNAHFVVKYWDVVCDNESKVL